MDTNVYGIGLVPMIVGLVEVGKRSGLSKRYAPIAAVVLGLLGGFAIKSDIIEAVFFGVASGLSACGLYDFGDVTVRGK